MVEVIRKDPYGNVGFKTFDTKERAMAFLDSAKVRQDREDGFTFTLREVDSKDGG